MKKADALKIFGGVVKTAAALSVTHPAISALPEELPVSKADQVRGAAMRLKKRIPKHMRHA